MIFDSNDNDDDLSFEGTPKKAPPNSSLPRNPLSRSPFGSNADQVENLAPHRGSGVPAKRPTPSPFGAASPVEKPTPVARQRPQNPLGPQNPLPNRPAPQAENRRAQQAPPELPQNFPSQQTASPDVSSYLPPPRRQLESEEPESYSRNMYEAPPYEGDSDYRDRREPEVLSESELFLRTMREHANERSAEAKREDAVRASLVQPVANIVAPVIATPTEAPVAENSSKGKKKGRKGKAAVKPPKEKKYDGERKKILYIRLVAGTVAVVIGVAGFQSIFLPDSGPSKEMVMSAAKEAVNYTGFPTASGEQFAIDFAKAYFNFNSKDISRADSLARFASPDLIAETDISILSAEEYESIKKDNLPYYDYVVTQSISYGPYVVASNNLDDKGAVFTVKVGLESGTVAYLDVPVKYDPKNYSLTLAGPPSFAKPIQNKGEAKKEEWTTTFEGGGDDKTGVQIQSDLEAYLSAWALSDSTIVNRYILESATDNAKRGLQSSVKFNKIIELTVEPKSEEKPSTATARRVEVDVMWEDPTTGLRYPQQYRMLIGLNQEGKWAIHDIENFSVLN